MRPPAPLDPLTLPLHGSRLIEASAGTGKTFTIALLYVRLVLGGAHSDDDTAFVRPLTPPEILVVTFTNAATQELRERIRTRLVEAAEAFRQDAPPQDALLAELRTQYAEATWPACARRLALAAEWMDEAAVSTIHSWCYRMLREHAFDSGSLFSLNLENDQSELEQEVVRDYWRSFYYPLKREALDSIVACWSSPQALYRQLRPLLPEHDALRGERPPPGETLAAADAERQAQLTKLKAPWPAWLDELVPALEEAAEQKAFKGQSFNAKSRASWLGALRDWCESDVDRPKLTDAAWKRLTPSGMAEIWKTGAPPCPAAWEALAALAPALDALPQPRNDLLLHALGWCRERLAREQERRSEMGPNDLLIQLDRALQGPNREALAAQIQRQFPVALIDEFQDTDPVQYRIFDAVFDVAHPRRDGAILLIGDPKQAIYAFRGADIYTYLQARSDTAGRHVTLGTNFRSSRAMVEAVNHCFTRADAHAAGAFLFRDGNDDPLPFLPVAAKGRAEQLVRDGAPLPAMTLWHLECDEPLSKGAYLSEMAERCASYMAELLCLGAQGRAGFSAGETLAPLRPSDMAVLVNGAQEARAIRQALGQRGIKSVYLSDRDRVFSSPIALELERWLLACAEPLGGSRQGETRLRAALATPTLGLDLAALDHLNRDELAWEQRVEQFGHYHRLWQRQGVLPLIRRLMVDFDVPARLLGEFDDGERLLTDLLHLGELLQQASTELDGDRALIRFLSEAIREPDSQNDSYKLRLESDADLVKVITIHKSKGLEYPLVFLPFIASHRPLKKEDVPLRWHDDAGRLTLSLEADDVLLARADRERLGEDLRKLYVALTRARHATWLGLAPLKANEGSALNHVINAGQLAPDNLKGALEAFITGSEIELAPAPEATALRVPSVAPKLAFEPGATPGQAEQESMVELGHARTPKRPAREHWWIASYSALKLSGTLSLPATPPEPATAQEATALEVLDEPRDDAQASEVAHLHRFPRGPGPGTFLHGLLEWVGETGFARAVEDTPARDDMLRRRLQLRGWQSWHPVLDAWLQGLITTPLPLPGEASPLALTAVTRYQVELEFWFAAQRVDTRALDALVSRHWLPGHPRPALDRDTLNGMLKGFIDLAFEHEGRFYVLDWKSSYLGPDDGAYTQEAMHAAMLEKRYDLQAALYLLAMHRLLKARQPDYTPEAHLGGSMTLFLRGSHSASRGVVAERPTPALIEALDALFTGRHANAFEETA